MDTHKKDLLSEHLAVLDGVGDVTLDGQFYSRLQLKMERRAGLKERRGMQAAVVTVGVLFILLTLNLFWLVPDARTQSSVVPDGVADFASYYDQPLSPDL